MTNRPVTVRGSGGTRTSRCAADRAFRRGDAGNAGTTGEARAVGARRSVCRPVPQGAESWPRASSAAVPGCRTRWRSTNGRRQSSRVWRRTHRTCARASSAGNWRSPSSSPLYQPNDTAPGAEAFPSWLRSADLESPFGKRLGARAHVAFPVAVASRQLPAAGRITTQSTVHARRFVTGPLDVLDIRARIGQWLSILAARSAKFQYAVAQSAQERPVVRDEQHGAFE